MNILFVEHDARALARLQQEVSPLNGEFTLEFARSGHEALDILSQGEFDVIVSEMHMPDMNGAELLGEVQERHPQVIRIILSDDSDEQAILRLVGKSHQFLAKPCDPDVLRSTVSRACALRDLLAQEELSSLISQIDRLPSLPTLYMELVQEIKSPNCSVPRVAEIISRDVAMVAKVLQLANSAYFGLLCRVTSPQSAVMTLGLRAIQSLALTSQVFSQFDKALAREFHMDQIVDHCISVGAIARSIARAERGRVEITDDSLTAGLLHDIGKLVLAANMPDRYSQAVSMAQDSEIPIWEAESRVFGCTHAAVGAYLMVLWGQPESVVEAIAFHHSPLRVRGRSFRPLTSVHVADAWEHEQRSSCIGIPPQVDMSYINDLGLDNRMIEWRANYSDAIANASL